METKEAIEKVKDKYEGWMGYARSQKEIDKLGKERDKVVSLLQQGENDHIELADENQMLKNYIKDLVDGSEIKRFKKENEELKKYKAILQLVEEEKIQAEINDCGKMFFILEANDKSNKIMFSLRAPFRHLLCHTLRELQQKYLTIKEKTNEHKK